MSEIVVGVDGSDASRAALRWALAQAERTGLPLRAVYAYSAPVRGLHAPEQPQSSEEARVAAEQRLAEVVAEETEDTPVATEVTNVREGNAARALCDAAKRAELLVVGSRGLGGFTGLLVGSVSQQCVQYAPCPVVVVRAEAPA
jgi:nucleotide-binding universal stress UspA family protein